MNRGMFSHTAPVPAPMAMPGGFSNLVIKVTGNTTLTMAADYVTMTDGQTFITRPLSCTIDLSLAAGGPNRIDNGTVAAATWYSLWANCRADGTTEGLAGTSAASPKLPPGFLYKKRLGWVSTAAGSSSLMGTWQFGRRVQYKLGLAQTTVLPVIANGSAGTYHASTPTWSTPSVASLVPTTASMIGVVANSGYNGQSTSSVAVAPTNSYSGITGVNTPLWTSTISGGAGATGGVGAIWFMLEGATVAWASSAAGGSIHCLGWEDNI